MINVFEVYVFFAFGLFMIIAILFFSHSQNSLLSFLEDLMGVSMACFLFLTFILIMFLIKPHEPQVAHEVKEIIVETQGSTKTITAIAEDTKVIFPIKKQHPENIYINNDQYKDSLLTDKDKVRKQLGILYINTPGENALYIDEETYNDIFNITSTTYQLSQE